jgi:hypothetical protein
VRYLIGIIAGEINQNKFCHAIKKRGFKPPCFVMPDLIGHLDNYLSKNYYQKPVAKFFPLSGYFNL